MKVFAVGEVVLLWLQVKGWPSAGEWRKGVITKFSSRGKNFYFASENIRGATESEFEYPYTIREFEEGSK